MTTPSQLTLDAALAQVEAHADSRWFACALAAVEHVARTQATFTADEVWRELPLTKWSHVAHEPRALGAVFREAMRRGWCVNTRTVLPSMSPVNHHRPVAVWRSLLK